MTLLALVDPENSFPVRFYYLKVDSLILTIGYLLGSIPFGYLVAGFRGIDIRRHGSGNIGATNVLRVLGKGPGYTVFTCDALKGWLAVRIGSHIALSYPALSREVYHGGVSQTIYHYIYFTRLPESIGAISAAIACIIGHNFPVWLRFKGGKGMATSAGVLIGMMPWTAASCMLLWLVVFFATRYVSLASIAASIALPVSTMIFLLLGIVHGWPYFYFAVAACILAIWRHRSNIVRLMNGTENRFVKKPKAGATPAPEQ